MQKWMPSFRGRRRVWNISLACGVFSVILFLLYVPFVPSLIVSSGNAILFEKIIGAPEFEIVFRHSYNRGGVRELYRIAPDKKNVALFRSYNQSFGAGMLDTAEATKDLNFRREGQWFIMDFPLVWRSEIRCIGGGIAGQRLIYDGTVFEFGILYPGRALVIGTRHRSLLQALSFATGIRSCTR